MADKRGGASAAATHLIHQTNAQGQALQQATPHGGNGKQQRSAADVFLRILCCFPGGEPSVPGALQNRGPLLPPPLPQHKDKPCLVLDLDETLVHSSFKPVPNPDYVIPVEIEGTVHSVFVLKRPGCDLFIERLGKLYEIVIFTASLSKYAQPLLGMLDRNNVIPHRLYRESCTCHEGNYVKDLRILGRPIERTIIVDNSPMSYMFQPENAIGVSSFVDDPNDRELFYALPFLEGLASADNAIVHLPKYASFIAEQARKASGEL